MNRDGSGAHPVAPLLEAASLVVDPPATVLPRLLTCIETTAPEAPVRLLLSQGVADALSEEFLLESRVAAAVEADHLAVRRTESRCADRAVLAPDRAGVLVSVDREIGVLPADGDRTVSALHDTYEPVWTAAEPFSTRAPPRDRLYELGRTELSESFASQFEDAVEHASTLAWHGSPTPVELALAVAARTRAHHYDLCGWAEQAGFTSRSTMARTKQQLEDAGLLDVEPVPQQRGRPRQRLVVGAESVAETDAEALVPTLRELTA